MRLDQYHEAVMSHVRERKLTSPVWWKRLGELLDEWGDASAKVQRELDAFIQEMRGWV